MAPGPLIYHLTPRSDFLGGIHGDLYSPPRLELDGFVHCATREVVLSVARDYFADLAEPLLVLGIEPARLGAELRYEAPAPIAGGGTEHLEEASVFPHVYGPIELAAVNGIGVLARDGDGYGWPAVFASPGDFVRGAGWKAPD